MPRDDYKIDTKNYATIAQPRPTASHRSKGVTRLLLENQLLGAGHDLINRLQRNFLHFVNKIMPVDLSLMLTCISLYPVEQESNRENVPRDRK